MKRILLSALVLCALAATAMPTKEEQSEAQAIVNELMKDHIAANKKGKESNEAVGDAAMALAKDAQGEAAKFALFKGAVTYYARGKAYEKAADAVEAIMAEVSDVPPQTLNGIVQKAAATATEKKAPRLVALKKAIAKRAKAAASLTELEPKLKKSPSDPSLKRMHAELLAATGDWKKALEEFAALGGEVGKIADDEANVSASTAADFWWGYTPAALEAKDAIKEYASTLYRRALDNGELEGLKKNLAEKRLAEFTPVLAPQGERMYARKNGLIHRWSFNGNLKDSVGKSDGKEIDGKVTFEKGQVRIKPDSGYVDLGANVIPGGGKKDYTIEVWATKYSIQNWARVFHIPDNWGENDYYWSWNAGTEPTKWGWKVAGEGVWYRNQGDGTGIGVENHFVVVYYAKHPENNKPWYDMIFMRGESFYWGPRGVDIHGRMFNSHSAFWLGHSPYPKADPNADASYNEVRIWNRALTRDEIIQSAKLGPDKLP